MLSCTCLFYAFELMAGAPTLTPIADQCNDAVICFVFRSARPRHERRRLWTLVFEGPRRRLCAVVLDRAP